ncbi:uncharacterized protein LOC135837911 [Planococcus citri]|uniref:uncharacterized protein LOC135837911 n=1 Tax=Planococcus citri TaxID=170843 RepID=UPI0031F87069
MAPVRSTRNTDRKSIQSSNSPAKTETSTMQTRSSDPDTQSQSSSSKTSIMPIRKYSEPNRLLHPNDILPDADMKKINDWWIEEMQTIEYSFSVFTKKKYFVPKYSFINTIFEIDFPSYAVFFPTGCCKTVTAIWLEFFFSFKICERDRDEVRLEYLTTVKSQLIEEHEGKYYVIRFSFRKFPLDPEECFYKTLYNVLEQELYTTEPELFEDANIRNDINSSLLLNAIVSWLHKKYGKRTIVIIDDIDYLLNRFVQSNVSASHENRMKLQLNNVLTNLSSDPLIERAVLFGIHPPHGILRSREWWIIDFHDKNAAECFMFTSSEVQDLLARYQMEEKISQVEKNYGNYQYDLFCPASVVAYVTHNGKAALYKWFRDSGDISKFDIKSMESWLAPFIDGNEHRRYIDINSSHFVRPVHEHDALLQYTYAGLLKMDLPDGRLAAGLYKLSAGNSENLSIIAHFLEKIVNINNNYRQIDTATKALNECNFPKLATVFNIILESFKPTELASERDYRNAIKVLFKFIPGWKERSNADKGTVNQILFNSCRTDFRVFNHRLNYLYIFEVNFIERRDDVIVNRNVIKEKIQEAFKLIKDKRANYTKIQEVAMICHGEYVTMVGRPHAS